MLPENGLKIGYLTSMIQSARDLLLSIQKLKKAGDPAIQVFPATDTLRLLELIGRHQFDLIILEEELIEGPQSEWVKKIESAIKFKDVNLSLPPMILLLGAERKPEDLKTLLGRGFNDVITRPVDQPIFIQKIDRLIPKAAILSESQFFRMETTGEVRVAISQAFESVSETDAVILSNSQTKVGDVVSLFGEPFNDGMPNREVVAVCLSCVASNNPVHPFRILFSLQGITPQLSQSIRKWIKSESARLAMRRNG